MGLSPWIDANPSLERPGYCQRPKPGFLGSSWLKPAGSSKSSRRPSNGGLVREIERFARDFEGFDREIDAAVRRFAGSVR
jgi:hypothetical protein